MLNLNLVTKNLSLGTNPHHSLLTPTMLPILSSLTYHSRKSHLKKFKKREMGDCWFCDEKWVHGHKCGQKQLLMIDFLGEYEVVFKPPDDALAKIQHMELSE